MRCTCYYGLVVKSRSTSNYGWSRTGCHKRLETISSRDTHKTSM